MILLIILAAILFIAFAGTSWILVVVVKRNEEITREKIRAEDVLEYMELRSNLDYDEIIDLRNTIADMERGSTLLTETLVAEHQKERELLERIIANLLQKQDKMINAYENMMIAGGGGSADPEDQSTPVEQEDEDAKPDEEFQDTSATPLRVVRSG